MPSSFLSHKFSSCFLRPWPLWLSFLFGFVSCSPLILGGGFPMLALLGLIGSCLCVFSSHASVTRRRKPPMWRLMSGGSTDCVTWWPLRSAWWVTNADTPCDRLAQHQMEEPNKWYPQRACCTTGREYVVENIGFRNSMQSVWMNTLK